jgi:transaldolase
MNIKLFADSADTQEILSLAYDPRIAGFTTNPTLMRKAGVTDYEAWARNLLGAFSDNRPFSFEVIADDFGEMERQARTLASWGENLYVKIPITNTRGVSAGPLIRKLSGDGIKVNVTAIMTLGQACGAANAVAASDTPAFLSVFAGRIADTGVDPVYAMEQALAMAIGAGAELIWASPREVLNVYQAERIGCHAITATPELLKKLDLKGKDLGEYSLETVRMFHRDAREAGYAL